MYKAIARFFLSVHFFAMVGLLALTLFPLVWPFKMPAEFWMTHIVANAMFGILYFVNIRILSPKLQTKASGVFYVITVAAIIYLLLLLNGWVGKLFHEDEALIRAFSTPGHIFVPDHHWDVKWSIFLSVVFIGLSNVSVITTKFQKSQLAYQISEKERISAELSFLKAQINPHFFFNTLHTIYSLMDTDQPSAKNSIYNLSHMMRYVLYETQNDRTSLFKEVGFIEDYIALMKVRIAEGVQLIFDRQPGIHDMPIAPMLFLPFVENAFKHGISAVNPSYIFIEISETAEALKFEIRNSLFEQTGNQITEGEGIGIANTRRRLDLLYPEKYGLMIERDTFAREYAVTLTLNK